MANDKPINAMYGQKVKLDLDKLKNRSKDEPVVEKVVDEPVEKEVVEQKVEEVVDEPVEKEVVEQKVEEVVDEPVEAEVVEQEVEETVEEVPEEVPDSEEEVAEDVPEETADEPAEAEVEEVPEEPAKEESNADSKLIDDLKTKLTEREKKLSNQSSELNYLTNKVIPKFKKENAELNKLKRELTDALEKSTRKYFDQLDINADLSNQIGKIGAEGAVNKVRADKYEAEIDSIKAELQSKIDYYKEKFESIDVDKLQKDNASLGEEVKDLKDKLSSARKENIEVSEEVDKLRAEIIDLGNYKDEVDDKYKKEIEGYKEEISSLSTQLKLKESSYDKLSNDSKKTIADLNNQIKKLEDDLEKESNKGLFNRFK